MFEKFDSVNNECLLLPLSFMAKFGWFLPKHWRRFLLRGFILKSTERAQVLLKDNTRDFKNNPPSERLTRFDVTISESFKRF